MSSNHPVLDPTRHERSCSVLKEMIETYRHAERALEDEYDAVGTPLIPEAWKRLIEEMQREVYASEEPVRGGATTSERRSHQWARRVGHIADMLAYTMDKIRSDLDFEVEDATLASMVLVDKAVLHLDLALRSRGESDREETKRRTMQALQALTPPFEDVQVRRLRALRVAERAAAIEYGRSDFAVKCGWMVRSWLADTDERFEQLDPMAVFEEFSQLGAEPCERGKIEGVEGGGGPARALASLAVICGALGYAPREDEDFESVVERARTSLLANRARIRQQLRAFPTRFETKVAAIDG